MGKILGAYITPHGPLFSDAISISYENDLKGSFADFGRGDLKFEFKNNSQLVDNIIIESERVSRCTKKTRSSRFCK